ncbi:MAG: serine/threonine protein kinase [Kiritimatiellia bacterium]
MSRISLPGFQVLDTLRQTSKTITVKAVQISLERTVALTFLRPELATNPNEVRRFLNIARVCAQLKADGLPQIYDINSQGDQPYLIVEHVEGLSVSEIVGQVGPLAIPLSVRITITIADALGHTWEQSRLVHRNLKPSEIRIDGRGTPKLTDFGRATIIQSDGRQADEEEAGIIIGTPNFLSPEQVQGLPNIDCRSDIYSLGATLYYMVTGHVPFPDCDPETVIQKQISAQISHPRTYRPDLSANISGLIARMMMKLPEDRYADWTEAMGDMNLALKNQPLRRRDVPPKGISTVASVVASSAAPPAPELPQLRKVTTSETEASADADTQAQAPVRMRMAPRSAAASAARDAEITKTDHGLPMLVRIAMWFLLVIWLVLLGNDRLNNPLQLSIPSPLLPLDNWFGTASNLPSPAPVAAASNTRPPVTPPAITPPRPPVTPSAASGVGSPPSSVPAPSGPAAVIPAPSPKPPEPEKTRLPQIIPPDTAKRLADSLVRGDLAGMRAILAVNLPMDPARLAEFRRAASAIPDPLQLAEQTIEASKGQELSITYLGKDRKIIPRSVANGEIEADFTTADGNRAVTLKLVKFSSDELLKLLPARPESPATRAAVCLVLLKANRKAEVAAHVPHCGLLGPLFEAAAAQLPDTNTAASP